ncbi:unnamed protein product [Anisakis simplex]|uniref:Nickel/cobalt efflux system n=1 Tax=Anisakis simplex TaxID=6269 RepID=A0A0M3JG29_ANISI|nr:unnamed protein product [Anisakis simplex]
MLKLSAEHEKREDDGIGHARSANEHDHEHEHGQNVHKAIGLSLIIGFIVMLIIDQATRSATFKAGERPKFKMTATIGLVVHAAGIHMTDLWIFFMFN